MKMEVYTQTVVKCLSLPMSVTLKKLRNQRLNKLYIALMNDKIEKKKASKRASQLPEVLDDFEINEIYTSVLGKERPGRMRGFGVGVVQDQVPEVGLQKIGVHLEVQAMKEKYEAEIETIRKESQGKEDKLREEISQQALATTEKFKNMDIAMKKQEALLAVLLGAYEPSDLLAAIRMKGGFACQPSMSHIQPSYDRNMGDVFIPQISSELQDQVATNRVSSDFTFWLVKIVHEVSVFLLFSTS